MVKKNRIFNEKLKNSWETYQKIEEQFDELKNKYQITINYINSLNEFDKKVWIMYCEYNSLRKVADETNVNKNIIDQIIKKIKLDLKEIIEKDKKI